MKFAIAVFMLLAVTGAMAEEWPAACGPKNEKFELKVEKPVDAEAPVPPEQAAVYFVTKLSRFNRAVYMVAIDGAWVGALRGDSYFRTTVPAGVHHACLWVKGMTLGLVELNVAPTQTYYVRGHWRTGFLHGGVDAEVISSDEGKYLVSTSKRSTITRK